MMSTAIELVHTRTIAGLLKKKVLNQFFSCSEIEYYRRYRDKNVRLAGCLAAKLAFIKVTQHNFDIPDLRKIEIKHTISGKPYIMLYKKKIQSCPLSISHTKSLAAAFCGIKNGKIHYTRKKKRYT